MRRALVNTRSQISNPGSTVLMSVASLREIVVKVRVGKLKAGIAEIAEAITRDDVLRLDIRPSHLAALSGLPKHLDHRDPFDHLPIAQAISEDATFLSEDPHAARYAARVLSCSDPAG